jgi:hypothetical protein
MRVAVSCFHRAVSSVARPNCAALLLCAAAACATKSSKQPPQTNLLTDQATSLPRGANAQRSGKEDQTRERKAPKAAQQEPHMAQSFSFATLRLRLRDHEKIKGKMKQAQ